MTRILIILLFISTPFFGGCGHLQAASESIQAPALKESKTDITPEGAEVSETPEGLTDKNIMSLIFQVFLFLALLAGGGYVLSMLSKKGSFPMRRLKQKHANLTIEETKVLGNKQFLVVVEYSGKKMLLGVGPGMIEYLSDLDASTQASTQEPDKTKILS